MSLVDPNVNKPTQCIPADMVALARISSAVTAKSELAAYLHAKPVQQIKREML